MKELAHSRGRFKGLSHERKDFLLKNAVQIIGQHFSYGVSVSVNINEFKRNAPKFVRGFREAYPFCCHLAMTALVSLCRKHGDLESIHYIFEAGHAFQAEAEYLVGIAAMTDETKAFYRYNGHSFLSKNDATPLQAADLLAWETAKFKDETLDSKMRDIRRSMLALFTAAPKKYSIHHCEGASLARHLTRVRKAAAEQVIEEAVWKGIRERINATRR